MKRPYEDNSGTFPSAKRSKIYDFEQELLIFYQDLNLKNWRMALQKWDLSADIKKLFRGESISDIRIHPESILLAFYFLLENHASKELILKFWVENKNLHLAINNLDINQSRIFLLQVLSLPREHSQFKNLYIRNIQDTEVLQSVYEETKGSGIELPEALWDRFQTLITISDTPFVVHNSQEQAKLLFQEHLAEFARALDNKNSNELLLLWDKSADLQRWYTRKEVVFGVFVSLISMEELYNLFQKLLFDPKLARIIDFIYSNCLEFQLLLQGNTSIIPQPNDLLLLFENLIHSTKLVALTPFILLRNKLMQNAIINLSSECKWEHLQIFISKKQTELLKKYLDHIHDPALLEKALELGEPTLSSAMIKAFQTRKKALTLQTPSFSDANVFFNSTPVLRNDKTQEQSAFEYR